MIWIQSQGQSQVQIQSQPPFKYLFQRAQFLLQVEIQVDSINYPTSKLFAYAWASLISV